MAGTFLDGCGLIAAAIGSSGIGGAAFSHDHDRGYYGGVDLHLVCYGEGAKPNVQTVPTFHWSHWHHELEMDCAAIVSRREFDSVVQIDIHGNDGHISIDGIEDFRGTCEEHNPGEQRRF